MIGIEAKPGWQLPPARFSEGELLAFFTAHHVMHAPAQKAARLRLHLRQGGRHKARRPAHRGQPSWPMAHGAWATSISPHPWDTIDPPTWPGLARCGLAGTRYLDGLEASRPWRPRLRSGPGGPAAGRSVTASSRVTGMLPRHPCKIQGYWRSLATVHARVRALLARETRPFLTSFPLIIRASLRPAAKTRPSLGATAPVLHHGSRSRMPPALVAPALGRR